MTNLGPLKHKVAGWRGLNHKKSIEFVIFIGYRSLVLLAIVQYTLVKKNEKGFPIDNDLLLEYRYKNA